MRMDESYRSCFCLLFVFLVRRVCALTNGQALVPPMGWLAWERFRCNVDCKNDPNNCISEELFRQMADHMAADGYSAAGYQYINVDDCWPALQRDANGRLQADPERFPSGMQSLAAYVHSKGLKFGIYEDIGTLTCAGYPGMKGYFEVDIATFKSWGIDMLKVDGCYEDMSIMNQTYPALSLVIGQTFSQLVFSCSWPAYVQGQGTIQYALMVRYCNLWRNFDDIQDSWSSLSSIIDFWASAGPDFVAAARPGAFNDPDMLIIGDAALNVSQSRIQFGMWAIFAAPLLMSNDLRNIAQEYVDILQNKEVIAVNQDPMARQGYRVAVVAPQLEVWKRDLHDGSMAVALLNRATSAAIIPFTLDQVGFAGTSVFARDLFQHADLGVFSGRVNLQVQPNDILMLRLTPVT